MFEQDVIIGKISIIRNCLNSIHKVTKQNDKLLDDHFIQDVFVLNLQRSIQACIDISHHICSEEGLLIPANYKQSFYILEKEKIISSPVADIMKKMVGFRNIAVHDYQELDPKILKGILKNNLKDFESFVIEIEKYLNKKKA
jgi:uncharacterized protein YutE (UPF0331/DUF86 family)